ncbi:MAG: hypothetical protein EOS73_34300 [Mesorhizobium sp.]|uniref:hypothetical protein n=1 Tax=Mesorhizobium sp. M7A.F.Ca.ET.027.02.1.1 TaxID=2496655 RepID=UPI000FD3175D|nr:hypothetical protein [Mesorhizobium sp. M7A.F.Ca.ET.027.02.1.1]RVD12005.1 hypothetical protein EN749_29380 [Mesorhizobium sp. M7A.F.Ca.ET.027.02.1.1]RWC95529.1 MAG: hypothetical protein EOS73_34300 [Mesorhizobium sp.]
MIFVSIPYPTSLARFGANCCNETSILLVIEEPRRAINSVSIEIDVGIIEPSAPARARKFFENVCVTNAQALARN